MRFKTRFALVLVVVLVFSHFFVWAQTDPAETGYDPYQNEQFDDDVSEGSSAGWLDCGERTDAAWYSRMGNAVKCVVTTTKEVFSVLTSLPETILGWFEHMTKMLLDNFFEKANTFLEET